MGITLKARSISLLFVKKYTFIRRSKKSNKQNKSFHLYPYESKRRMLFLETICKFVLPTNTRLQNFKGAALISNQYVFQKLKFSVLYLHLQNAQI